MVKKETICIIAISCLISSFSPALARRGSDGIRDTDLGNRDGSFTPTPRGDGIRDTGQGNQDNSFQPIQNDDGIRDTGQGNQDNSFQPDPPIINQVENPIKESFGILLRKRNQTGLRGLALEKRLRKKGKSKERFEIKIKSKKAKLRLSTDSPDLVKISRKKLRGKRSGRPRNRKGGGRFRYEQVGNKIKSNTKKIKVKFANRRAFLNRFGTSFENGEEIFVQIRVEDIVSGQVEILRYKVFI